MPTSAACAVAPFLVTIAGTSEDTNKSRELVVVEEGRQDSYAQRVHAPGSSPAEEEEKVPHVVGTHAVVHERTVVIHALHARPTRAAVVRFGWLGAATGNAQPAVLERMARHVATAWTRLPRRHAVPPHPAAHAA